MSRNPRKLEAFVLADSLVTEVYRCSNRFPAEERFALQLQIRRAAVSVAANLVEGCARQSERQYLHFVAIALGSAAETAYLITVAARLGFMDSSNAHELHNGYERIARALSRLLAVLSGQSPKSKAQGPT